MQFLFNLFIILSYLAIAMQIISTYSRSGPVYVKDILVLMFAPLNVATILLFWAASRVVDVDKQVF